MMTKATLRNSRTGSGGKLCMPGHNDRTKGGCKYSEKADKNKYWVLENNRLISMDKSSFDSFEKLERDFYNSNFQKHLDTTNQKYAKKGNRDRIKTDKKGNALPASEVYLNSKKTAPMETILQVGSRDTDISDDTRARLTIRAFNKYVDKIRDLAGDSYQVLDVALHMDEETPHLHIRGVFVDLDKDGNPELAQKRAIQNIKEQTPVLFEKAREPAGKKGDKDLIAWTDFQRELWYQSIERTAQEMNLDIQIDREVKNPGAIHKDIMEYKLEQLQEDINNSQNYFDTLLDDIDQQENQYERNQNIIRQQETQYNELVDEYGELKATCEDLEDECERLERAYRKYEGSLDDKLESVQRAANYETLEKFMGKEQLQEVVDNAKRKLKQIAHQRNQQHNNDFYER